MNPYESPDSQEVAKIEPSRWAGTFCILCGILIIVGGSIVSGLIINIPQRFFPSNIGFLVHIAVMVVGFIIGIVGISLNGIREQWIGQQDRK